MKIKNVLFIFFFFKSLDKTFKRNESFQRGIVRHSFIINELKLNFDKVEILLILKFNHTR